MDVRFRPGGAMAHQAGCRRVAGLGHNPGPPRGIRGPLRGSTRSERAGFNTTRQMGGEDAQRQARVPVKRTPMPNAWVNGKVRVENTRCKNKPKARWYAGPGLIGYVCHIGESVVRSGRHRPSSMSSCGRVPCPWVPLQVRGPL